MSTTNTTTRRNMKEDFEGKDSHSQENKRHLNQNKWEKLADKIRLRVTDEITEEPVILEFDDEFETIPIFKLGDFSAITGKPKVGKSNLIALITGTMLANKRINILRANLPKNKRNIIYFDTEMSRADCQKLQKKIHRYAMCPADQDQNNLIYFPLRSLTIADRIGFIDYFIMNTPNLGFVVIDGIRDLVNSINDEKEATNILQKLMNWTDVRKIHILNVLHENKINSEARGHLGSELMNKAETVMSMDKDADDIRWISPKYTRNKPFSKYVVALDSNEVPYIDDTYQVKDNNKNTAPKPAAFSNAQLKEIAKNVFSKEKPIRYTAAWRSIKKETGNYYENEAGDKKCKDILKLMQNKDIVIHDAENKCYILK